MDGNKRHQQANAELRDLRIRVEQLEAAATDPQHSAKEAVAIEHGIKEVAVIELK